jgi:hypothetical protein
MGRLRIAVAIGVALLGLSACARKEAPAPAEGLSARKVAAGEVNVTITPTRIDSEGAEFTVAFDTHTVDLDVAAHAALTVDDTDWVHPTWDGARPGGHHRQGTIRFTAGGPASGDAVLTIGGLDEPVTASWTLPAGG